MNFLGLGPNSSTTSIEARNDGESITAEQFVERLRSRIYEMERTLAEDEQLDVVAFLPSGKAISVGVVSYENPSLVILNGQEQETGKVCTLLAHQSSVQVLVSVEVMGQGEIRKVLRFAQEKW
ncbi:hypothetical protein [Petrachloros mirabilis]